MDGYISVIILTVTLTLLIVGLNYKEIVGAIKELFRKY